MKKVIFSLLVLLIIFYPVVAQRLPSLKFNDNGEFKICQFTDTHIEPAKGNNLDVYETVRAVLEIERPDLVILTGDIVTQDDPEEGYLRFVQIFAGYKIPWAVVFGNHESERNYARKKLAGFLHSLPFCLNNDDGKLKGNSNFILPIYGKDKKRNAVIYCMDSNAYSTLKPVVEGYGWFDFSQVEWYREKSRKFIIENGGKPLPALAFFHIPLPEYSQIRNTKNGVTFGVRNEDECCPRINTGMFAAMVEAGDVMGTFVGHDHINDYIGVVNNIALAYGRVTKKMKDADDPIRGGRVIVLKAGQHKFDTWIREFDGRKVLSCSYPDSFIRN